VGTLEGVRIGFAMTGSFCCFQKAFVQAQRLQQAGAELTPIFSEHAAGLDTRFGKAGEWVEKLEQLCGKSAICTIPEAEPLGPENRLDLLVVAPCTANTAAKLERGITDTTVTMAVKSMLRRQKPIVLAIATNDGLGASGKNIGTLCNLKQFYLVPLHQDDPVEKPNSLVAAFPYLPDTVGLALQQRQIQPLFI
jgi:dipicolinate synthase subunit B